MTDLRRPSETVCFHCTNRFRSLDFLLILKQWSFDVGFHRMFHRAETPPSNGAGPAHEVSQCRHASVEDPLGLSCPVTASEATDHAKQAEAREPVTEQSTQSSAKNKAGVVSKDFCLNRPIFTAKDNHVVVRPRPYGRIFVLCLTWSPRSYKRKQSTTG